MVCMCVGMVVVCVFADACMHVCGMCAGVNVVRSPIGGLTSSPLSPFLQVRRCQANHHGSGSRPENSMWLLFCGVEWEWVVPSFSLSLFASSSSSLSLSLLFFFLLLLLSLSLLLHLPSSPDTISPIHYTIMPPVTILPLQQVL